MKDIEAEISARLGDWVLFRRDLHRHPELGFMEFRTQSRIAERLDARGYTVGLGSAVMDRRAMTGVPGDAALAAARARAVQLGTPPTYLDRMSGGMTGLVGELRNGAGPVIVMRFDVDAAWMAEAKGDDHRPRRLGFASDLPDIAHAAGHDGHATIGLGLAELAAHDLTAWRGTLRVIFQPAEDGARGAQPMVEAGIVDDADYFYALRIGCGLPSGRIAASASPMLFSSRWNARFDGMGAHASANPEDGRNALLAAVQAVSGLLALPRHGRLATQLNVGRLQAGSARNIIPSGATMEFELRGEEQETLLQLERRGRAILDGAALGHGCDLSLEMAGRTMGARSSPRAVRIAMDAARAIPDLACEESWPLGGSDDAAFFMRRVLESGREAAYLILGSDLPPGHHVTGFDFNEADIGVGIRLLHGVLCGAGK